MRRLLFPIIAGALLSACSAQTAHKNVHSAQHIAKKSIPVSVSTSEVVASWYGVPFHGRQTANGERYNMYSYTAAHKTLPFGTTVKFTNELTGQTVIVRVTDRGPFVKGRDFDLSLKAAQKVGIANAGTGHLKAEILAKPLTGVLLAMQDHASTDAVFAAADAQNFGPATPVTPAKTMLASRKTVPAKVLLASKPLKIASPVLLADASLSQKSLKVAAHKTPVKAPAERDDFIDFAKFAKTNKPLHASRFDKALAASIKISPHQSDPRMAKASQPPTFRRVADSPGLPYYAVDDMPESALLTFTYSGDEWPVPNTALSNPSPKIRYVGRVQRPSRPLTFGQNPEWPVYRNNGT